MEERINEHLSKTPGLLEAVQQKENVFWYTFWNTVFALVFVVTYIND